MKGRLPIVLSITAVLVAVAGTTSIGEAASQAVRFARNADKVDGIHASRSPKAGRLLALNSARKFPASVLTATPVAGLEIGTLASAEDSSNNKSVAVNCPAGKRVVGGGGTVTGAATTAALTQSFPSSLTQWTAAARETSGTGASWKLTGYAVCVPAS